MLAASRLSPGTAGPPGGCWSPWLAPTIILWFQFLISDKNYLLERKGKRSGVMNDPIKAPRQTVVKRMAFDPVYRIYVPNVLLRSLTDSAGRYTRVYPK